MHWILKAKLLCMIQAIELIFTDAKKVFAFFATSWILSNHWVAVAYNESIEQKKRRKKNASLQKKTIAI